MKSLLLFIASLLAVALIAPIAGQTVGRLGTGFPIVAGAGGAPPAGTHPSLFVTPTRQATWAHMKADYVAVCPGAITLPVCGATPATLGGQWFKLVKSLADGTHGYNNIGFAATLMYQWTGDVFYATQAMLEVQLFINQALDDAYLLPTGVAGLPGPDIANWWREKCLDYIVMFDWLYPGITPTQRTNLENAIVAAMYAEIITWNGNTNPGGLPRLMDTDQTSGELLHVILLHFLFPANATVTTMFNVSNFGGLTATAADRQSMRNAVKEYVTLHAEGGEWMESGSYNLGTPRNIVGVSEAIKQLTGVDYFPEITAWLPSLANRQVSAWMPDLTQHIMWGDTQEDSVEGRDDGIYNWTWSNLDGLVAGVLGGTTEGKRLQGHLNDLITKYGAIGYKSMGPNYNDLRMFVTFDPYAAVDDWHSNGKTFWAPGMGQLRYRTGFTNTDSLLVLRSWNRANSNSLDHREFASFDFELWAGQEWAITHPRAYFSTGQESYAVGPMNSPMINGIFDGYDDEHSGGIEYKKQRAVSSDDTHVFLEGTMGGSFFPEDETSLPAVFTQEWTRGLLYLPEDNTIIVYDRAHVTAPATTSRYGGWEHYLTGAPSRKQWLFHTPVSPTPGAGTYTWTTAGGTSMKWTQVLPTSLTRVIAADSALDWSLSTITDLEKKYRVSVYPSVVADFDTFLNVFQRGSSPGAITLLQDAGKVQGVHVVRAGQHDAILLFNSTASAALNATAWHASHAAALDSVRLRTTGFTPTGWTASASTTDLYLADLSPTVTWKTNVDGAGAVTRTPTSGATGYGGLVRFSVSGTGAHSLVVTN